MLTPKQPVQAIAFFYVIIFAFPARSFDVDSAEDSLKSPDAMPGRATSEECQPDSAGADNTRWPEHIGPFEFESDDGLSSIRPGLTLQLLFYCENEQTSSGIGQNSASIQSRRIRPTIRGNILSRDIGYYLHLSTNVGSLELMDLYFDFRIVPDLVVRAGQCKIPFTRYRIMSFKNLTFPDWASLIKYFGAERQMGLSLHNGYEKQNEFAYVLGVYTGQNARASQATGLARTYGISVANPSDLTDPAAPDEIHPELVGYFSYNYGGIDTKTDTDWNGGGLRFSLGLSAAWDIRPVKYVDIAQRVAPEFLLKVSNLSFFSAFFAGFVQDTYQDESSDSGPAITSALVQTSYLFMRRVEIIARYAFVDVKNDILEDARMMAESDADITPEDLEKIAFVNQEHETALGINFYIIGTSLKLQTDVAWLGTRLMNEERDDVRVRSQLTLTF